MGRDPGCAPSCALAACAWTGGVRVVAGSGFPSAVAGMLEGVESTADGVREGACPEGLGTGAACGIL